MSNEPVLKWVTGPRVLLDIFAYISNENTTKNRETLAVLCNATGIAIAATPYNILSACQVGSGPEYDSLAKINLPYLRVASLSCSPQWLIVYKFFGPL